MTTELLNIDCMHYMAKCPDKLFDLAIVDPPYGLRQNLDRIKSRGRLVPSTIQKKFDWDRYPPPKEYFDELFRISKNQIIWGANHFISRMPYDSSGWIVWDKQNSGCYADAELAWTSFTSAIRIFKFRWAGMLQGDMKNKEKRIHPTQKPVKLYDWLLREYAKPEFSIFDSHLGSGSSAIAAHFYGTRDFVGCEIDEDYCLAARERFKTETAQLTML